MVCRWQGTCLLPSCPWTPALPRSSRPSHHCGKRLPFPLTVMLVRKDGSCSRSQARSAPPFLTEKRNRQQTAVSCKALSTQTGVLEAARVILLPTCSTHHFFISCPNVLGLLFQGPPMNQGKSFAMASGCEGIVETVMVLRQLEYISLKPLHFRALFRASRFLAHGRKAKLFNE